MTNATMALAGLLRKTSDADLLREMLGLAAARLAPGPPGPGCCAGGLRRGCCPPRELDVGSKTGAALGEKSAERLAQRNGYRERVWETRAGTIELHIPELRKGSYFTGILEPRRLAEKALTAVIHRSQEAIDPTLEGSMSGDIDGEGSRPSMRCRILV